MALEYYTAPPGDILWENGPMRIISYATLTRALVILLSYLATAGAAVVTDRPAFSLVINKAPRESLR
jgi:hypothetical protein